MGIRLIDLDLDKTLLHNNGVISDYSIRVLTQCRERGILIAIATARSEFSAKRYVDLIEPNIVITSGGAIARCGNKIFHKVLIPKITLNAIIQDALKEQSIECIRVMGEIHELSNNKNVPEGQKDYGHYDYSDLLSPLDEGAWKIQFETANIQFLKELKMKYSECELISYTNENLHKMSNIHANKRDAILGTCDKYGLKIEEVAAFGDDYSDYELINIAGMGVAVENAIEPIKIIANFVCESNEDDGVAKFIKKHTLKGKSI